MKSKFVFTLIIVAGFGAAGARAQSDRLLDLMGIWSRTGGVCKHFYQLSATSGNAITIRYERAVCKHGAVVPGHVEEYRLNANGRSLTGTRVLKWHLHFCRMPMETMQITGRIAPDWNGLVIVIKKGTRYFNFRKCARDTIPNDTVLRFSRHR